VVREVVDVDAAEPLAAVAAAAAAAGAAREATGEYRIPWLWVEGWRARLRKCGDVIEQTRWEFRMDDRLRGANELPLIVAVPKPGDGVLRRPGRRGKSPDYEGSALRRSPGGMSALRGAGAVPVRRRAGSRSRRRRQKEVRFVGDEVVG
jgi:hypothetical protein